ncbi:MAG TPA: hypothetical protein PLN25_10500 [Deltaproteobacteria bacterium]|nr:hypothetical protein [Deltaproteobacteria bacterium]HQB39679.1 hypothetical protein [Deltaproteobacteria bacterium]
MESSEIIMNLWCIYDQQDEVIYGVAGRTYYASGTDEEKTALLKQLALTDFMLATRMPVPESFSVEVDGELTTGLCPLSELHNSSTTLFKELINELQYELVLRHNVNIAGNTPDDAIKIPDNPLFLVSALVEDEDGKISALMVE